MRVLMSDSFSNNATPKYLGYVYQVLVAIEQCIAARKNQIIWLECFGDVYDGNTSTEVKHSIADKNLTANSVEFWQTLKNLTQEDSSSFKSLILHTTAKVPKDSIFYGWNELPKTKKYELLTKHTPADTIKSYYDVAIVKCSRKHILPILDRLIIKSSQANVKDKWEELKESSLFHLVAEHHKEDALDWVYGYVNKAAIEDAKRWHIKINDFASDCRVALSKFTENKIYFQSVDNCSIDGGRRDFLFVEEMRKISLKEMPIQRAVSDYLRAGINQIDLLKREPITMQQALTEYDNTILGDLCSLKDEYADKIEHIGSEQANEVSRELYFAGQKIPLLEIQGVSGTQQYYKRGRIHSNVNEKQFFWRFFEDDLL